MALNWKRKLLTILQDDPALHGLNAAAKAMFLGFAASDNDIATVRLLLQKGADARVDLHKDANAFRKAARYGYTEIVGMLLEKSPDIIHEDNDNALRWAAYNGHTGTVALLLEKGADIHAMNDDPVRQAARNGHTETVALLLENDADFHEMDNYALRWAEKKDDTEIIALLVNAAGPKPDEPYLHYRRGFLQEAQTLLALAPQERIGLLREEASRTTLRHLVAAGLTEKLFPFSAWKGEDGKIFARNFWAGLKEAFPEYGSRLDGVDMTLFKKEALSSHSFALTLKRDPSLGKPVAR